MFGNTGSTPWLRPYSPNGNWGHKHLYGLTKMHSADRNDINTPHPRPQEIVFFKGLVKKSMENVAPHKTLKI